MAQHSRKPSLHTFAMEQIAGAIMDGTIGFCRVCGSEQEGCEPDARNYKCETCGARMVFGAEELMFMGCVK